MNREDIIKLAQEAEFSAAKYPTLVSDQDWEALERFAALVAADKQKEKLLHNDWKLVPREATPEMLKAMDECAQEGYDERLYAGMASSVYMAAWDASPVMGSLPTSNTFKEWFYSKPHRAKYSSDHPAYLAAQEAWEAAHEACAKVVEASPSYDWHRFACETAAAIRARGQE